MTASVSKAKAFCPREEIFAYVDGELSVADENVLEEHLSGCKVCTSEVNAQKKVSNSLEIILEDEMKNIELPENFTEVVKTKAESNVSGLRKKKEISRALIICASLFLLITVGLGAGTNSVSATLKKFADQFSAIFGFIFHLVYDVVIAASIILRSVAHKLVSGSVISLVLLLAFFLITFYSLSRLIYRYNRS